MHERFTLSLTISEPQTAINALSSGCTLSRSALKKAMVNGAVWLKSVKGRKRRLRKAQYKLSTGDLLDLFYDKHILDATLPSPVLLKREHYYSIWYKPAFVLSQGTLYGDHLSLLRFAEKSLKLPTSIYLIHRLDREASGLMILAHSKSAAANLSGQFKNRSVRKRYRVKVVGKLVPFGKQFSINQDLDKKPARSVVTVGNYLVEKNETEVEVEIQTGRMHQIRRHLSLYGFPVSGDHRYGGSKSTSEPLQLCACELEFSDPLTKKTTLIKLPTQYIKN